MSGLMKVMLETRQTGDVLAGQDGRLGELFQTYRARSAKPAQDKMPDQFSAHVCACSDGEKGRSRPQLSAKALVMKGVEDPDQLLQCYHTLDIR